jgi:putative DNA primase/helicase
LPNYIRAALSEEHLEAPDKELANGQYESLISLYQAHALSGIEGAKKVWKDIRRFRPDLAQYDPDAPLEFKPDDDQIALALAKEIEDNISYFHSQWKIYETGCWRNQSVYEFRREIRKALRTFRHYGVAVTQTRIKSLASMLEDDLFVADRTVLERQKEQAKYINLRNGLFNLETLQLEDHRPDLFFTTQLDFDYEPHAMVNHFMRYLNSSLVFPNGKTDYDLVRLVLEGLAYSMTARTDMKSSFWLVGQKDSGKSTFIALIKALMGDLHTTIDLTQLGVNRFLLAGIVGKRVITFTEASSSTFLPDALYKTLVGGSDEVYADVKNKDPICFRPEAKVWWAMNEMPRVSDRSGATTRRIVIIPFNRTIAESDRIPDLERKLISERPGIFNLLIDHLAELQQRGSFIPCDQSEAMRQEYIRENDTEATFIDECGKVDKGLRVQAGALYARYADWCNANGFKPKNSNQVAKEWRRLGFEHLHSNGKWWQGIELNGN